MDYIAETWIGSRADGRSKPPLFPVEMWSLHNRYSSGALRTTNARERFHKHFASFNTGAPHPSIAKLLKMLHKQQALTNVDLAHVVIGHEKPEKAQSKKRNAAIAKLMEQYLEKGSSPLETAKNLAFHYME